ncbi:hypothetical protein [Burkholderia pseudomallei]|uniref:hypothetical protein n=1 Tax=Burkholderia pseudomallei TaxID=28450 RepID=UPI00301527B5
MNGCHGIHGIPGITGFHGIQGIHGIHGRRGTRGRRGSSARHDRASRAPAPAVDAATRRDDDVAPMRRQCGAHDIDIENASLCRAATHLNLDP